MSQPIICFEGPSGIGKTTLVERLSHDFHVVPEVNLLFPRGGNEAEYWYHERQVERYQMCLASNQASILDGDVFQPIWYNWACAYPPHFLSQEKTHAFYRKQLAAGKIAFPDLYLIFQADEEVLWERKKQDKTRQRRNFEKHLKIIEPLKEYYRFLDQETDLEMRFIEYRDVETTQKEVLACIESLPFKERDGEEIFDQIQDWIKHQV